MQPLWRNLISNSVTVYTVPVKPISVFVFFVIKLIALVVSF